MIQKIFKQFHVIHLLPNWLNKPRGMVSSTFCNSIHGFHYHKSEGLLVPVVDEDPLRSAPGAALQRNGLPCPLCCDIAISMVRRAPNVVIPTSRKSLSVRVMKTFRSISCSLKTLMYFSMPMEMRREVRSVVFIEETDAREDDGTESR